MVFVFRNVFRIALLFAIWDRLSKGILVQWPIDFKTYPTDLVNVWKGLGSYDAPRFRIHFFDIFCKRASFSTSLMMSIEKSQEISRMKNLRPLRRIKATVQIET